MQHKHLFEYATIRVVPRVEREEFINIGVILYCKDQSFLQCRYLPDEARVRNCFINIDLEEFKNHLLAFERISVAGEGGGPIAKLDMPSRFRWLTATRSTILQTSKVHPGFCYDAESKIIQLYNELVL